MNASQATNSAEELKAGDYLLPAELFVTRSAGHRRGKLQYHRFATVAEAIDYAMENYSALRTNDLVMAVDDKRFNLAAVKQFQSRARDQSDQTPVSP